LNANRDWRSYLIAVRVKTPDGFFTYPDAMAIRGTPVLSVTDRDDRTLEVFIAKRRHLFDTE
jgi:hypothetical protein